MTAQQYPSTLYDHPRGEPIVPLSDLDLARLLVDDQPVGYETIRVLVKECQAARDAAVEGTAADYQDWAYSRSDSSDDADAQNNAMVSILCDRLRGLGATFYRVTKEGDRIYVDGWRVRPAKMADFKPIDPPPRSVLAGDKWSGNFVLIPADRRAEFEEWQENVDDGETPLPMWAHAVDIDELTFVDPQVGEQP